VKKVVTYRNVTLEEQTKMSSTALIPILDSNTSIQTLALVPTEYSIKSLWGPKIMSKVIHS
jgi:hypothetical protein